ncbi:hypothetical protein [Burkholderia vietnamiensis]|uniref:hypothetical protein n=1 Tax=Burkholderia vietnamiensis TaxID=60552 RepID=UPI00264C87D6|nr:hypothetical protein [Burkholderia vietnamiensis]MDN7815881.1 hypothetical protein [Burkholderia vietnamiensis]
MVKSTAPSLRTTGAAADEPKGPGISQAIGDERVGSGAAQDKQKAYLNEIIEKVNGLFEGYLTDDEQLVNMNGVLKSKLLENETLVLQAMSNRKEQFANSPDLKDSLLHAIMDALEAHNTMSTQALGSEPVRDGLKDILLVPARLYSEGACQYK